LFAAGIGLVLSVNRARDRMGGVLFWLFVATLAGVHLASVFGPSPPSVQVLAISGLLGWLFVAWACRLDRDCTARAPG